MWKLMFCFIMTVCTEGQKIVKKIDRLTKLTINGIVPRGHF